MAVKIIEFENIQQYRNADSDGLERTLFGLFGEKIDCPIAINHTHQSVTIYNEGRPEFLPEMQQYFVERLGGSAGGYEVFDITKSDKESVANVIEDLATRFKVVGLHAEYKK